MSNPIKASRSLPIPSNPQIIPFSKNDRDVQASRDKEVEAFKEKYSPEIALLLASMSPRERASTSPKNKGEKKETKAVELSYIVGKLNGDGGRFNATAKTMMVRYTDPETGELKWFPKMSFDYKCTEWKQQLLTDTYTSNIQLEGEAVFLFVWFESQDNVTLGRGLTWTYGKVEAYASMKDAERAREYWMNKPVECKVEITKNFTKSKAFALAKRSART